MFEAHDAETKAPTDSWSRLSLIAPVQLDPREKDDERLS